MHIIHSACFTQFVSYSLRGFRGTLPIQISLCKFHPHGETLLLMSCTIPLYLALTTRPLDVPNLESAAFLCARRFAWLLTLKLEHEQAQDVRLVRRHSSAVRDSAGNAAPRCTARKESRTRPLATMLQAVVRHLRLPDQGRETPSIQPYLESWARFLSY